MLSNKTSWNTFQQQYLAIQKVGSSLLHGILEEENSTSNLCIQHDHCKDWRHYETRVVCGGIFKECDRLSQKFRVELFLKGEGKGSSILGGL